VSQTTIELDEAQTRLTELVRAVANGGEIVLTESGQPVARITGVPKPFTGQRIAGLHANEPGFWMSDDFDAPLPDEFWLGEP
jgi:prevent-host-death family protein